MAKWGYDVIPRCAPSRQRTCAVRCAPRRMTVPLLLKRLGAQPGGSSLQARATHCTSINIVSRYRQTAHFPLCPRIATWQSTNARAQPTEPGNVMTVSIRVGCFILACALFPIDAAVSQPATLNCSSESSANATETVRCAGGLTIVAEDGAQYTLRHRGGSRDPSSAELTSKALLLEVSKKPGGHNFRVDTPQAVAAVRGTKWAVDVGANKTSVFVARGRVAVGRRAGIGGVTLGPGEGVDVEAAAGPLIVKRWPAARVSALMARLGQ